MTLWFDHGVHPSGKVYNYVTLPGMSSTEAGAYAANPEIAILANNSSVQAVKETSLNMIGANFWTNTTKTVDMITSSQQASVMTKENTGNDLEVAVSDPTMNNTGTIELELARSASGLAWSDPEVTVTQISPTIKIAFNVSGAKGKTIRAKFDLN
jgi:Polysaccharide lyase family 8, C-terminal beta-sandwich domain.